MRFSLIDLPPGSPIRVGEGSPRNRWPAAAAPLSLQRGSSTRFLAARQPKATGLSLRTASEHRHPSLLRRPARPALRSCWKWACAHRAHRRAIFLSRQVRPSRSRSAIDPLGWRRLSQANRASNGSSRQFSPSAFGRIPREPKLPSSAILGCAPAHAAARRRQSRVRSRFTGLALFAAPRGSAAITPTTLGLEKGSRS